MERIKLYKHGYEPFVDFLKGYLILTILFCHSTIVWPELRDLVLYHLFGGALTAGFMLVCSMQIFRNGIGGAKFDIKKICIRVLLPFIVLQLLWIFGHLAIQIDYYDAEKLSNFCLSGGFGIGSYFPWAFVQYYLLNEILILLMKRIDNDILLFVLFAMISVGIECLCSYLDLNEYIFRLLALQYPFLIFLGYCVDKYGLGLNAGRSLIAFVSATFILIFNYVNPDLEPFFYKNGWKSYHWVCYPYYAIFLFYVVYCIYCRVSIRLNEIVKRIGRGSYGVFLFQMIWFSIPIYSICYYKDNPILSISYIVVSMLICVPIGVIVQEKVLNKYFNCK